MVSAQSASCNGCRKMRNAHNVTLKQKAHVCKMWSALKTETFQQLNEAVAVDSVADPNNETLGLAEGFDDSLGMFSPRPKHEAASASRNDVVHSSNRTPRSDEATRPRTRYIPSPSRGQPERSSARTGSRSRTTPSRRKHQSKQPDEERTTRGRRLSPRRSSPVRMRVHSEPRQPSAVFVHSPFCRRRPGVGVVSPHDRHPVRLYGRVSPTRRIVVPIHRHYSPPRRNYSPRDRSPSRHDRSPSRREYSPQRRGYSPDRGDRSPPRRDTDRSPPHGEYGRQRGKNRPSHRDPVPYAYTPPWY